MRWIFIFLVFLNLLLLAYFWQQQENTEALTANTVIEVPSKGKGLVLLSELTERLKEKPVQAKPNTARNNLCYAIGPFSEQQQASHLITRAAALGFTGKINELKVASDKPTEYWVFVPPRASREEAMRTLRELQGRKFDSYIITQGDMADGVSLGLFRNKDSAYGLRDKIRQSKIDAEVKVMNETNSEYWVEISESSQLSEAMRERIQAAEKEMHWEMVECH